MWLFQPLILVCGALLAQDPQTPAEQLAAMQAESAALPGIDPAAHPLAVWRAHLRPSAEELVFESLPWRTSFAAGLRAADAAERPLLLWVMNGHPLGCT
ncbi:MAG TPA: hypothetical protein VGC54_00795 [Planctomycetota bacterium]